MPKRGEIATDATRNDPVEEDAAAAASGSREDDDAARCYATDPVIRDLRRNFTNTVSLNCAKPRPPPPPERSQSLLLSLWLVPRSTIVTVIDALPALLAALLLGCVS